MTVIRTQFIGRPAPQRSIDLRITDPSTDTAHQPLLGGSHQLNLPISVHLASPVTLARAKSTLLLLASFHIPNALPMERIGHLHIIAARFYRVCNSQVFHQSTFGHICVKSAHIKARWLLGTNEPNHATDNGNEHSLPILALDESSLRARPELLRILAPIRTSRHQTEGELHLAPTARIKANHCRIYGIGFAIHPNPGDNNPATAAPSNLHIEAVACQSTDKCHLPSLVKNAHSAQVCRLQQHTRYASRKVTASIAAPSASNRARSIGRVRPHAQGASNRVILTFRTPRRSISRP